MRLGLHDKEFRYAWSEWDDGLKKDVVYHSIIYAKNIIAAEKKCQQNCVWLGRKFVRIIEEIPKV